MADIVKIYKDRRDKENGLVERGVMRKAREEIESLITECFNMAKMKSHGFDTYDDASEIVHELDIEIDKFIKENCA